MHNTPNKLKFWQCENKVSAKTPWSGKNTWEKPYSTLEDWITPRKLFFFSFFWQWTLTPIIRKMSTDIVNKKQAFLGKS